MDLYSHVRVLFSIILGLGVSHILRGVARIVQHPKAQRCADRCNIPRRSVCSGSTWFGRSFSIPIHSGTRGLP